jgi:hypothetical protein
MATTDQGSASNISSQRGQEEIRLEVGALVQRVVPEEAGNIEEMMPQFKGREEELVETLRRMQERLLQVEHVLQYKNRPNLRHVPRLVHAVYGR